MTAQKIKSTKRKDPHRPNSIQWLRDNRASQRRATAVRDAPDPAYLRGSRLLHPLSTSQAVLTGDGPTFGKRTHTSRQLAARQKTNWLECTCHAKPTPVPSPLCVCYKNHTRLHEDTNRLPYASGEPRKRRAHTKESTTATWVYTTSIQLPNSLFFRFPSFEHKLHTHCGTEKTFGTAVLKRRAARMRT